MNILITGGAGFVGSNLVEKLLSTGHTIICIDNFDDFYDPQIKKTNLNTAINNNNFSLIEGDIREKQTLNKCFENKSIDVVVHLAAKAGVRPSIDEPKSYYDTNLMGTLNILECMKKYKVKKIVFASSSSVYGNNPKVPFAETDNVDFPISPYAASKKAGELLCHTYHHLFNFDVFCLRFFTVYGPRQRPDLAIHKFSDLIINNRPVPVFGDGLTSRDYTFIEDIVNGITEAVNRVNGFEIINLGESKTVPLFKMIETLENYIGKSAQKIKYPIQSGDVNTTCADISKARKILGYNPVWSFEDGIKKFIEWKINSHF